MHPETGLAGCILVPGVGGHGIPVHGGVAGPECASVRTVEHQIAVVLENHVRAWVSPRSGRPVCFADSVITHEVAVALHDRVIDWRVPCVRGPHGFSVAVVVQDKVAVALHDKASRPVWRVEVIIDVELLIRRQTVSHDETLLYQGYRFFPFHSPSGGP